MQFKFEALLSVQTIAKVVKLGMRKYYEHYEFRKVYPLECTGILKAFFTPHHASHCCRDVIIEQVNFEVGVSH